MNVFEVPSDDPDLQAGLAKIEEGISQCMTALYRDDPGTDSMIQAWSAGVETLGYTQEGKRVRRFEALFPLTQSMSASRGALITADEGILDAFSDPRDEDE